jgi:hypothetical protein
MVAASYARKSTAESVLRREDQVELGDGRADRGQVCQSFGIRGGVFDDRRHAALGLLKVGQHEPQDAIGAGFGHRLALAGHGEGTARTMPRRPTRGGKTDGQRVSAWFRVTWLKYRAHDWIIHGHRCDGLCHNPPGGAGAVTPPLGVKAERPRPRVHDLVRQILRRQDALDAGRLVGGGMGAARGHRIRHRRALRIHGREGSTNPHALTEWGRGD